MPSSAPKKNKVPIEQLRPRLAQRIRTDHPGLTADALLCRQVFFFFHDPATTEIYTLSLHDALPISSAAARRGATIWSGWKRRAAPVRAGQALRRSEEHTSELQSQFHLVCRLLL